MKTDKPL